MNIELLKSRAMAMEAFRKAKSEALFKATHKYYKRVPKKSGKGFVYYYTKVDYEKAKGEKSQVPSGLQKKIMETRPKEYKILEKYTEEINNAKGRDQVKELRKLYEDKFPFSLGKNVKEITKIYQDFKKFPYLKIMNIAAINLKTSKLHNLKRKIEKKLSLETFINSANNNFRDGWRYINGCWTDEIQ